MNQQMQHRERKQLIYAHLRANFTDQVLADLLAHAQDGKLVYLSCCCLRGFYTADHPYAGEVADYRGGHYELANSEEAIASAPAYAEMGDDIRFTDWIKGDELRRRILIPMIRAEMKRRANLRIAAPESKQQEELVAKCV
jgi:hypothetical protein